MSDDTTREPSDRIEDDPTDTLDLDRSDAIQFSVTRGETGLQLGPPRDYPDRADLSLRPAGDEENGDEASRIVLSVDAMAGDHGRGYADVELTPAEARTVRDRLDRILRWLPDGDAGRGIELERRDDADAADDT